MVKLIPLLVVAGLAWSGANRTVPTEFTEDSVPPARAVAYDIDPVHTTVVFSLGHMGVSRFYGTFTKSTGTVEWSDEDLAASKVTFVTDAASVDTHDAGRDKHVRGPEFLNVARYSDIKFTSTTIKKTAKRTYEVVGDLTLHGVTRTLKASVEKVGQGRTRMGDRIGFEVRFSINRADFGIKTYPDQMLGHEMRFIVGVEGVKKK